ncbi:zf-DHHC-domain-containing protein, partial [Polyplosphaeria fusca]
LDRRLNQIMAVLMPLIELGLMGFTTYVLVYNLCIEHLIRPRNGQERRSTGIALIVVYCVLLVPVLLTFMRLLHVVWSNPGVVPFGNRSSEKQTASTKYFDRLDAYVCDFDGRPLWCDKCNNWKPDRAHHSSQIGRCIRRMDHFCPYAGGIISETSHKFFIQFLFYTAIYTGYVMIVMAIFLAERKPGTWIAALVIGVLFFVFTFGMFGTTMYNLGINYTTVEILKKGETVNIAVRGNPRSVVQTKPFENPWDAGTLTNIQSIMGTTLWDWLIPLKMPPCVTDRRRETGEYAW